MAAGIEQAGVEFVALGQQEFEASLTGAASATTAFDGALAAATGGASVAGTIITGALMRIGEIAVDSLGNAAQAAIGFFQDGFASAMEAEQTMVRIENLLGNMAEAAEESMGQIDVASILTMDQVSELGLKFQDLAGGTDDVVLSIIELGTRMGSITADEMPNFIQTTLDMAAATGQNATQAARILAMAQEDPASAIGRLRRQGILFTEQQEEQIKEMQKSGDIAGAFALVMDRVALATEGAAAAQAGTLAGRLQIIQNRFGEAGEALMSSFVGPLADQLLPVIDEVLPLIDGLIGAISTFLSTVLGGGDLSSAFDNLAGGVYRAFGPEAGLMVMQFGDFFTGTLLPAVQSVIDWVSANLPVMQATFEQVWAAVSSVLETVSNLITGTIIPAIASIWEQSGAELPKVEITFASVMEAVGTAVTAAADFINNVLVPAITTGVNWVVTNWPRIQATIETVMNAIQSVITTILSAVQAFWERHGAAIMATVQFMVQTAQTRIQIAMNFIQNVITTILDAINVFWAAWGDTIMAVITNVVDSIQHWIDAFMAALRGDWESFGEHLREIWNNTWENIKLLLTNAIDVLLAIDWGAVGGAIIEGIANGITAAASFLQDAARNAAQAALEAAKGFLGIESPSKRAGKEIGKPFVEGISDAMDKGQRDIEQSSVGLAGSMIRPAATMSQMAGMTIDNSKTASMQFGDVHINNGWDAGQLRSFIQQTVSEML